MSDATNPPEPADPPAAPTATPDAPSSNPSPAAEKPAKRGRWRRRIIIGLLVVITIVVLLRLVLLLTFPTVLRKVAARYGLDCNYERLEMYLIEGDVGIWHLSFTPRPGSGGNPAEPVIKTEYCRANVSATNLLRGRLVVHRVEADGVDLLIDRDEKGEMPLIKQLLASVAAADLPRPPAPQPPTERTAPHQIILDPPLRLDAVRLNRMRTRFRDRSVSPAFDTTVDMTARLSDVGSAIRPMSLLVDVTSSRLLDFFRIEGGGDARGTALDASFQVVGHGLHLKPAAAYLAPLGVKPLADDIAVKLNIKVNLAPATAPAAQEGDLGGTVVIENVATTADLRETTAIDKMVIDIAALNAAKVHVANVAIEGVRGDAALASSGNLRVAGVELLSRPPTPQKPSAPLPLPAVMALDQLTLRKLAARFRDESVTPPADLALVADEIVIKDVSRDAGRPDAKLQFTANLSSPGIARTIRLDGTATPFATQKQFQLKVLAQGIKPDAVRGYLDAAGVESQFQDGTFSCDVSGALSLADDGRINADARLANVKLSDGKDLFAFDAVHASGVSLSAARDLVRAEAIEVSGPVLAVTREPGGALQVMGLRTKATTTAPATPGSSPAPASPALPRVASATPGASAASAASPATGPSAPPTTLPVIEIGKFAWKGVKVRFEDRAVTPASEFALDDAGLEVSGVKVDLSGRAPATQPGKIRGWLSIPGVAGKLSLDGTIAQQPQAVAVDLAISGDNLNAQRLQPYIAATGIEPVLKRGSLKLRTQATLAGGREGLRASLALTDLLYADGAEELVKLAALKVDNVALRPDGLAVGTVSIDKPHARIAREKDGALRVGGVRIPPPATQPAETPQAPPPAPAAVAVAAGAAPAAATSPAASSAGAPPPALVTSLGSLRVSGASIDWHDAAVEPAVAATARADVKLDGVVIGRDAPPAKLDVAFKVDKAVGDGRVTGTVSAAPTTQGASLEITANGINPQLFEPYLPPNVLTMVREGQFRTKLDAAVGQHPQGGRSARLVVDGLDYRDAPTAKAPLFRFDSARVIVSRLDVPGKVVAIDEVSLAGLETSARVGSSGSWNALGMNISPAAEAPAAAPGSRGPGAAGSGAASATAPAAASATAATAPAPAQTDVAQLVAARRQTAPLVTLEKLDVQIRDVSVTASAQAGAQPVSLRDVRLRNLKRVELLGDNPGDRPPVEIELTGQVEPLVKKLDVKATAAPFANTPTAEVAIAASGISGEQLTRLMPELAEQLDGRPLRDGTFSAKFEAQAKVQRLGPAVPDFSRPFEASFVLDGVALRNGGEGGSAADQPVLIGVEEVRGDAIRVNPATGDVVVRSLEVSKPMGHVWRDAEGIHALGCILKLPAPAADGSAASTKPSDRTAKRATPPASVAGADGPAAKLAAKASPATTPARPASEIRIDKLIVSGIDFRVEDRTVNPVLVVPLNGLEVEIRGLSNLAQFEDRPIRFSIMATADKVEMVDGREAELFSEVATAGNVTLHPRPGGWARSSVSGFELLPLAGVAKQQGVELGGGVFDGNVDVRFKDDGALDTKSRFAFTDLKLSEPPDGPIRKVLQLPAPLNAVLIVLRDQNDTITIPLSVGLKQGEISGIHGAVVGALASVVGTAIASSPLKVTGGVTSIIGLKKEEPRGPQVAAEVAFAAGAAEVDRLNTELAPLLERLRRDGKLEVTLKHELGGGDVSRAAGRASPPIDEAERLAERLRERKADLLEARRMLAGQSRVAVSTAPGGEAARRSIDELRAVDRDIAATEDALDSLYDLLRPGADRQAGRRTRAASLQLADARLEVVKDAIESSDVPNVRGRVRVLGARFTEVAAGDTSGGRVVCSVLEKK